MNVHSIEINGAKQNDKNGYQAYQVFRGDISNGKLTNITWGTGVVAGAELTYDLRNHRLIGAEIAAALDAANEKNQTEAEAVASVVATWGNDSEKLDAFAEVIGNHLSGTYASNNADYDTINVIGDGYYLLQYTGAVANGDAYTKYILKVAENIEVTAKKDAPSSDKVIVEGENEVKTTNGSVGDVESFKITTTVPNMNGYDKYYYIIHDTLSAGLTFNNDIEITVGNKPLTAWETGMSYEDYDYVVNVSEDGHTLEIVFIDFLNRFDSRVGEEIVTTYSATINENAVITKEGNTNKAWLEYSNNPNYDHDGDSDPGDSTDPSDPTDPTDPTDPNPDDPDGPDKPVPGEPTGTTPESIVKVFTTTVKINKVAEDNVTVLSGAKFKIEGESLKVYKVNAEVFQKDARGTYYRLMDGTYTETAPTDGTAAKYESTTDKYVKLEVVKETRDKSNLVNEGWVDANGMITFENLGEGTYTITELIAPAGYNLLKSPITVNITWNGAADDEMWTVTASSVGVDGEPDTATVTRVGDVFSINVVNQAGVQLPSTGGMGTTLFYIVGGLMVLAAVVLLVTKRRMNNAA